MTAFHDCSSAAQYAALGQASQTPISVRRNEPIQLSDLEAMGRCVGTANTHPAPAETIVLAAAPRQAIREDDYA
ncbi:hypothetical protein ACOI1H_16190 [Loktanella sp. DJP18]|uniref:hypothetical protein n=1 Tax=Loktanella sp. DJP18 TaxID=3409788 RepID=UPI003BB54F03